MLWTVKKKITRNVLTVQLSSEVVLPNTTYLDVDVDLTATELLDVAIPIDGEDFVATFLVDAVVPIEVPG